MDMPNLAKVVIRSVLAFVATCAAAFAGADYADDWGPEVGSQIPAFELADSTGELQNLDSLASPSGLLLFFTRSADW